MNQPHSLSLEVAGLSAGYGNNLVLDGIDLAIPRSKRVSLVGPNGAGKSTLLKAIVGLITPWSGEVRVAGQPARKQLDSIAYVPQREEIDWRFPVTVLDVVLMGRYGRLGWLRQPGRVDKEVALHRLDQVGIADLAHRPIEELSGGQQQRTFLARALAQEPELLLLDEPFAGVDAQTQEMVLTLLDSLSAHDVTVLVSTHDLPLAASRFDLLVLLNRRLVAFGPPSEALTPTTLSAALGPQLLMYRDGESLMAATDHCCPPTFLNTGSGAPGRDE